MTDTFGMRLRQRREQRGIALDAVAEQTKLKRSLLEGLERDDLSQWPAGIFRRSWLRTYARAIGLDADAVVQEFLSAHPDPEETAAAQAPPPPAPRFRGLLNAALGTFRGGQPAPPPPVQLPAPVAVIADAVDLEAVAKVCTDLGRVESATDVPALLGQAARLMDADGLIVWVWDGRESVLRPALVHGYAPEIVARLPPVKRESHNATAAAYRSGQPRVIAGGDETKAGFVVPLLIPPRCAGVLAVELRAGMTPSASMCAVATILAAAIAQVVARAKASQVQARLTFRLKAEATSNA